MNQHVFLIPVKNKWLLHAPLHHFSALLNKSAVDLLRAGTFPTGSAEIDHIVASLTMPPEKLERISGEVVPSFLGIIPTRGCNIGCVYCNFGGPTAEHVHMDPSIAISAIDWMAQRLVDAQRKVFHIHFFGGEPLISPDIIDIVVHRTRWVCSKYGLESFFDASTNGVFNEVRCRFVGDYFNGVVLSLDGFPEYHNRTRPTVNNKPTFNIVERSAKIWKDMPIELCLRICITNDSVEEMEAITAWACETFQPSIINFETLTPGVLAEKAGLVVPDPFRFGFNYLKSKRLASNKGIKMVYSAGETDINRLSFCPVGTDALIVSLDGRTSACYLLPEEWQAKGLDMDVGWVHRDGRVEVDFDAVNRIRILPTDKPRCKNCFAQWTCAGGCHVNQTFPGSPMNYGDFCVQTRIITACSILEDLDQSALVDQVLADQVALENLALHDWESIQLPNPSNTSFQGSRSTTPEEGERERGSLLNQGMGILG